MSDYKRPSEAELKQRLTPMQYHVTQEEGTEPPFENVFWNNKQDGIYVDIVWGEPLFISLRLRREQAPRRLAAREARRILDIDTFRKPVKGAISASAVS